MEKQDRFENKLICKVKLVLFRAIKYLFRPVAMVTVVKPKGLFSMSHQNWGDDLNYYFIKAITHRRTIFYWSYIQMQSENDMNLLGIGSLLHLLSINDRTVVWGTGFLDERYALRVTPRKICAVRGPLTQQKLLKAGFSCPAVFGDPALLLPLHYRSKQKIQKGVIGFIPHISELKDPRCLRLMQMKGVKVINLKTYKHWTDIIDAVCQCEFVLSSSLHGLIVSEAYGIPNVWIEVTGKSEVIGGHFKYHDFFCSINRDRESPYLLTLDTTLDELCQWKKAWKLGVYDPRPLIAACPLPLYFNYEVNEENYKLLPIS